MSKGFFRTVLQIASIAVTFIPGIGWAAKLAITVGLALATSALGGKKPKPITDSTERLNATFDVNSPRRIVYGTTALATDIRYQAYGGTNDSEFYQVIALASHKLASIDELWFDNEQAWAGGAFTGKYASWTTMLQTKLEGTSGGGYPIDSRWTANCSLTGCSYLVIKYLLKGTSDKDQSVWAGGITSRMTIRGKGAPLYDPRLDSTRGGSGSHRADDQTTWTFTDVIGNNPALQLLHFMLGWKIGGKLAVGMGIPPARIDFASFITAANICDESVILAAGGTERRYRSAGIVSETDDRTAVIANLCQTMNGFVRDSGGKLSLQVLINDLSAPVADFTEGDILGEEAWAQTPSTPPTNVMRGRWIDPSNTALYAPLEFPEVRIASFDGIDRIDSLELAFVQSASQAQRLAKTRLQRVQYQGRYTAVFGARAWQVSVGDVVRLSHQGLGWANKLFRVVRWAMDGAGRVQLELLEENAAIYAWTAATDEQTPVSAAAPVIYDPRNAYVLQAVLQSLTVQGVGGASAQTLSYDSTGAAIQGGGASLDFFLSASDGPVTSGTIAASFIVVDGTVKGFTAASGAQTLTVTAGIATLDLTANNALTTDTATVKITITRNGLSYYKDVSLTRVLQNATLSGGGGSSGTASSQASGFSTFNSGTFTAVSAVLSYTMPTGKTTAILSNTINSKPSLGSGTGSWTIEGKWQRNTGTVGSPVWTDVSGAAFTGVTTASFTDPDTGRTRYTAANMSGTFNDTGLTAGNTYQYRWVERIATGSAVTMQSSGSLSITS